MRKVRAVRAGQRDCRVSARVAFPLRVVYKLFLCVSCGLVI